MHPYIHKHTSSSVHPQAYIFIRTSTSIHLHPYIHKRISACHKRATSTFIMCAQNPRHEKDWLHINFPYCFKESSFGNHGHDSRDHAPKETFLLHVLACLCHLFRDLCVCLCMYICVCIYIYICVCLCIIYVCMYVCYVQWWMRTQD